MQLHVYIETYHARSHKTGELVNGTTRLIYHRSLLIVCSVSKKPEWAAQNMYIGYGHVTYCIFAVSGYIYDKAKE